MRPIINEFYERTKNRVVLVFRLSVIILYDVFSDNVHSLIYSKPIFWRKREPENKKSTKRLKDRTKKDRRVPVFLTSRDYKLFVVELVFLFIVECITINFCPTF